MFEYGPHTDLIIASYVITSIVLLALIAWGHLGEWSQRKALVRLEKQGIKRRSSQR